MLVPALLITACTQTVNTHGQVILPSRLQQVKPGISTRDDVLQLLGSPSAQGTLNSNRWYYVTSTVATSTLHPYDLQERKVLIVDFDPTTGTVANIAEKTGQDGNEISPLSKTTPTHGQSMGIIEQAVGNFSNILKK